MAGSESLTASPEHETSEAHPEEHPNRDRLYVKVAIALAIITALETAIHYEPLFSFGIFLIPTLIVCMAIKFYLVAAYFMHLRWDRPILRRVFITGVIIALAVYVATLAAFKFFAEGVPH